MLYFRGFSLRILYRFLMPILFGIHAYEFATADAPENEYVSKITALVSVPDSEIDLLKAKLVIDKLIDPAADIVAVRDQVDQMQADIGAMLPDAPTELDKVLMLRRYLYDPGPWNNNKPFAYDLDDPQGQSKTSRLLHNYIRTRKGNCVSMPILHAILGRRLGLNMTLASAPRHVFVRFTNEQGHTLNIEATSGGHPARDEWYRQNMPMIDEAIKNGVFLRTLSSREAVAVMGHDLVVKLSIDKLYETAIHVSEHFLVHHPKYGAMLISRGYAYQGYIDQEFYQKYPTEDSLPPKLMPRFQELMGRSIRSYQTAENLGWRHEDDFDENGNPKPLPPLRPEFIQQDSSPQNMEEDLPKPEDYRTTKK